MRHGFIAKIVIMSLCASALSACGSSEVKTGSLTQTYDITDAKGVHFGKVELDPINGGVVSDSQGRPFARIVPYAYATASIQ